MSDSPALPAESPSADTDRARLTSAVLALRSLAHAWQLTGTEAAALAGVSGATMLRLQGGTWDPVLSEDLMLRICALIGLSVRLHLLFKDDMADRWPRLPNAAPLFAGRAPVEVMAERGVAGMLEVRRYVDALRQGY